MGEMLFRPRRSWGWAWMLALALLVAVFSLPMLWSPGGEPIPLIARLLSFATVGLAAFFVVVAAMFPAMRYTLADDALLITCGPLLRWRLPYVTIDDVRHADLRWSLWSSMRVPGYALWSVPYVGIGQVRMCATSVAHDVLLLQSDGRLYGITPAEEDAFVSALLERIGGPSAARSV